MLEGETRLLSELVPRRSDGTPGRLGSRTVPKPLPAHVGLWIDRVIALPTPQAGRSSAKDPSGAKGNEERRRLYQIAIEALRPGATERDDPPAVAAYRHLFARWMRHVEGGTPGLLRKTVKVEARSRILLHPASQETVTEGSLLLHHTYGVPYLPGSGLKGVLRQRLRKSMDRGLVDELLGRQKEEADLASAVDLFDALWVPERPTDLSAEWSPLALDVVTPHHPDYYTAKSGKRRRPTDRDQPTPVHRLTVAPGARFLVVLEMAEAPGAQEWLEDLLETGLLPALEEDGFGAWTSAGYGRLTAAGSTGGRSRPETRGDAATAAPEPVGWYAALVVRDAGSGGLSAALEDGRRATALGPDAERLLESLPTPLRDKLRGKKKSARVEAQIGPHGTSWQLLALRPLEH